MGKQMQIAVEVLKQLPLLQTLSDQELLSANQWLTAHKIQVSQAIVEQGKQSDGIFIVLQGELKISTLDVDNQERGLLYIGERNFCGELSILDDVPSSANVVASQPTWILRIPKNHARRFIQTNALFAHQIMIRMSRALRATNEKVMMLSAKSDWRVYYFLRSLGQYHDGRITGKLPTHQAIASMINLSRETVTRNLSALKQRGLIEIGRVHGEKVFSIRAQR